MFLTELSVGRLSFNRDEDGICENNSDHIIQTEKFGPAIFYPVQATMMLNAGIKSDLGPNSKPILKWVRMLIGKTDVLIWGQSLGLFWFKILIFTNDRHRFSDRLKLRLFDFI